MKHCGQPAEFVVRDLEGLEWFCCAFHGDPDFPGARWIVRTPIAEWFRARAIDLPNPPRLCNEGRGEAA